MPVTADAARPDVVVVIPTRGSREALLERAVSSILANGYPGDVSVVVVADGVNPDAVRGDWPAKVAVHVNARQPGPAGARNTGLLQAASELVAFCDDDDEWLPGKLERQVALLQQHPEALVVGSGIRIVLGEQRTDRRTPVTVGLRDLLRDRVMALHSSTLVLRREAVMQSVGLLDEALPGGFAEDYDLLLRVARRTPVLSVPDPLVQVYWHGGSYYSGRWVTIAAALEYLFRKHPDFRLSRPGRARLEAQIAFALAASNQPSQAVRRAARAFVYWPAEPRVAMAVLVALRLVSADTFQRMAERTGRGL